LCAWGAWIAPLTHAKGRREGGKKWRWWHIGQRRVAREWLGAAVDSGGERENKRDRNRGFEEGVP